MNAARANLQHYQAHRDDPWTKAYFDKSDPLHSDAVMYAAQLMHLAHHGSVEIIDDDGNPTLHPVFQDREEFEEITKEGQSHDLAKHGIKSEAPMETDRKRTRLNSSH